MIPPNSRGLLREKTWSGTIRSVGVKICALVACSAPVQAYENCQWYRDDQLPYVGLDGVLFLNGVSAVLANRDGERENCTVAGWGQPTFQLRCRSRPEAASVEEDEFGFAGAIIFRGDIYSKHCPIEEGGEPE